MKLNKQSLKNTLYATGFGVLVIASSYGQTPIKTMEVKGAPMQYTVGDFDNNNIDDIASVAIISKNFNQELTINLQLNKNNNTKPTTKIVAQINKATYGKQNIHLLAGDFNGDGNKDLYLSVIHKSGEQAEYYFQGDGKGNFTNKTSFK